MIANSLLILSCKKDSAPAVPPSPSPTVLAITFLNTTGNKITGVKTILYENETDFRNKTNALGEKFSNTLGTVSFENLSAKKYYWNASLGCENNWFGLISLDNELKLNQATSINNVLESTGLLTLSNTSTNLYEITMDVKFFKNLSAKTAMTITVKATTYQIKVKQLSGYTISPIEQIFAPKVQCDQEVVVTFPI